VVSKLRARLTYANVAASVALFIALGGTSYAVATGSIDSREIKNNSIRGADVRNSSLAGADVRDNRLTGADIRDNRLTGADVLESSLGKVPSAGAADTASTANSATVAGTALQTSRSDSVSAPATTPGQNWTLLSADVPAGSYVLMGKATLDNSDAAAVEIRCFMRVGSTDLDRANIGLGPQPGDEDIAPFTVTSVHSSATPFTVVLECTNQGNDPGDTTAQDRKIVAHPVAGVVSTQAAGP
jgi:uncharacterized protein YjbI with pentapeptide repeats